MANEKTASIHDESGDLVDARGRRFSKQNGEFFDETGHQFSGYDPNGRRISVVDDIFGEIKEGGPDYRAVGWIASAILMMKTQIGLGVLSIPETFDVLGMGPGLVALLAIGAITTWSDYMVGVVKSKHSSVYGIDDVGQLVAGKTGRYILATAFVLYWIFCGGAGMLGISTALNALSTHGACTAVFVAVAAVAGGALASIQTFGKIGWLAWVGITCILTAILTLTIAVGVEERPSAAPQTGVFVSDWKAVGNPSFYEAISALSSMVFAFSGTPAFFSIMSGEFLDSVQEMKQPEKYTRSMAICQTTVTVTYSAIGIVVYYYCGSYVASPALGSAGALMKKVCYGIALPGLLVSTLILLHVPAKYLFVRIMKGSKHLTENTLTHWLAWLSCSLGSTVIAYLIASSIPVFDGLVSLVGALLGTLMCFQPFGLIWLYDNWHLGKTKKSAWWIFMVCWSVFIIVSGTFLMVGGTYGSVVGIIESYKASGGSGAFSCADNSNSVSHRRR